MEEVKKTEEVPSGSGDDNGTVVKNGGRGGRKALPVPQPDKNNANFWYFLKQCIGKELTKITMPVAWNEPLSLLQRISEYMNYAYLLKVAAQQDDVETRMELVAAFAVSALASNHERMGKPFNPLLGETYQLDRPEFRLLCEQVGHHPPVSAFHANNPQGGFIFHGSMYPKIKFWGKSVEFQPKGILTVEFPKPEREAYTWNNVNCIVHNIIVGSLWMEHTGTMEITNHSTKHRCFLTFKPGGWFSGQNDLHTVEGFITDSEKRKLKFIYGRWTEFLCAVNIPNFEEFFKTNAGRIDPGANNLPKHNPLNIGDIPGSSMLWRVDPPPENSAQYYNFSEFAMTLNERTEGDEEFLCPTDCRRRPDIRALENGLLDLAASEKERLENKQREYRKPFKNKKESEWWIPRWFTPSKNEFTREDDWRYVGGYWERDHNKNLPDIF